MKMRKFWYLIVISIFLTSCNNEKIDLSLNLEKGKQYRQLSSSKVTMVQEFGSQKVDVVMTVEGSMLYEVIDILQDDYIIDVQYESLSLGMNSPFAKMQFDSDIKDENDVFSDFLSKMTGNKFNIRMNKKGKIIEVKNIDRLIDSLLVSLPEVSDEEKEQMRQQINNSFGPDAFKGNFEMAIAIFPENLVKKGEKWEIVTNLKSGMSAIITTEYKLTKLTADYVIIKGTSVIKSDDNETFIETNGIPMKFDLNGSMISELKIDRATGWIIEANITQEIKGDVEVKQSTDMPTGLKMPMDIKSEMKFTDK